MLGIILSATLLTIAVGAPNDDHYYVPLTALDAAWTSFKSDYAKDYTSSAEETERKRIFSENLQTIEMHNYLYSKGHKSYMMGVNQFTDMTFAEFLREKTGVRIIKSNKLESGVTYLSPASNFTVPESVDWRQKGYVTPVKNQGHCGSCWAFSTTGSLEGQHFRKTGQLVSLSEQQLVDCTVEYGNQGCNGGWMANAFQHIKDNGGIDREDCYPYEGKDNPCHFHPECVGATVTGFVEVPKTEKSLTEAVANVGPVSVAIYVTSSFQLYKSGVYDEPNCHQQVNHAVLVVGYGTQNGQDYYIVKNSWDTTWGDNGYILMSRNKDNQCSIASYGIYPTV